MALMFQRLARNFAKNGYFPTDSETIERILQAITICNEGNVRIIDTAAGIGTALAEVKHHLGEDRVKAYGIEIDETRAYHAKQILDHCIHGDLMDCVIEKQSFSLLFLNPPYGDLAADNCGTKSMSGRERLEKLFYRKSVPLLQMGGIMILIIPYYSLDKELSKWISLNFEKVEVYLSPEQRFKQIVIFGIRSKKGSINEKLLQVGKGELPNVLPNNWQNPYIVPAVKKANSKFAITKINEKQLSEIVKNNPCLWEQFEMNFHKTYSNAVRPLMDLSNWHLALALAAGQVSGIINSNDGRRFLIKGDTYKTQTQNLEMRGNLEKRTVLDKFVPVIRAIDLTKDSSSFGNVLTIQ